MIDELVAQVPRQKRANAAMKGIGVEMCCYCWK